MTHEPCDCRSDRSDVCVGGRRSQPHQGLEKLKGAHPNSDPLAPPNRDLSRHSCRLDALH
eukprot:6611310-Prymnesium_polylepis.1